MNFAGYTNKLFEVKSRVVYSLEELTNYDFSQCWLYSIVKYDRGYIIRFRGDAIPFAGPEIRIDKRTRQDGVTGI